MISVYVVSFTSLWGDEETQAHFGGDIGAIWPRCALSLIFVELLGRVHPQPRLPSRAQLNQTPPFLSAAGTNLSISEDCNYRNSHPQTTSSRSSWTISLFHLTHSAKCLRPWSLQKVSSDPAGAVWRSALPRRSRTVSCDLWLHCVQSRSSQDWY